MPLVQKIFRAETKVLSEQEGLVQIVASTAAIDRDGEVVLPKAWGARMHTYLQHPVLLSSHDYKSLRSQIGELVDLKITEAGLEGVAKYYVGVGNPEADWGFELAKRGRAAYSVGFLPHEYERGRRAGEAKVIYSDVELLEISHVVIPSNRESLQVVSAKSADPVIKALADELLEDLGAATEPEEKCMDAAPAMDWHRYVPQEQAQYDPVGGMGRDRACANCHFFLSPNRCSIVTDWPAPIAPTGLSRFWMAPVEHEMKPMEVVIVEDQTKGVGAVEEVHKGVTAMDHELIVWCKHEGEVGDACPVAKEFALVEPQVNWDLVRRALAGGEEVPYDVLIQLAVKAVERKADTWTSSTATIEASSNITITTVNNSDALYVTDTSNISKAGRRNSAADMDKMRQVMGYMDTMMGLMREIMGDESMMEEMEEKAVAENAEKEHMPGHNGPPPMNEDQEENDEEEQEKAVSVRDLFDADVVANIRRQVVAATLERITAGG